MVDTHRGRSSVSSSSSSSSSGSFGFRVGEVAGVELSVASERAESSAGSVCMAPVGMGAALVGATAVGIMEALGVGTDQVGVICVGLHQVDAACVGCVHVVVVCADDAIVDNVYAGRENVDAVQLGRVHVLAADVGTVGDVTECIGGVHPGRCSDVCASPVGGDCGGGGQLCVEGESVKTRTDFGLLLPLLSLRARNEGKDCVGAHGSDLMSVIYKFLCPSQDHLYDIYKYILTHIADCIHVYMY